MKMINFESLKSANKKIQVAATDKSENYDALLAEALSFMERFNRTGCKDKSLLKKASEKLIECSSLKSNRVESYVFQAYIAFVMGNTELTNKYLSIAVYMDNESVLVKNFREMMTSQSKPLNSVNTLNRTEKSETVFDKEQVKVQKISRISRLK